MISIIVPVFKAEKYIHRCIDSILAQSYTDFELLLVDDGSPDGCGAICDTYAAKDSRVRVFHKENGGVSSARNLGLDNAQGEWITFVDSDDWLEMEFLERLVSNSNADLVIGGYIRTSGKREPNIDRRYEKDELAHLLEHNLIMLIYRTPWGKLLKRSIIDDNRIRYSGNIRFGEDTIFIYHYLSFCDSIATISYCGYNYQDDTVDWVHSSRKYKLSLSEIDTSLGETVSLINELNSRLGSHISSHSLKFVFIGMYSSINFRNRNNLDEYKAICQKYIPQLDDAAFYSSRFYSPILRGIMELKSYYAEHLYTEGKALYPVLYRISQVAPKKISFVYKDFYLWYTLVRIRAFPLCDVLLRTYLYLKKFV